MGTLLTASACGTMQYLLAVPAMSAPPAALQMMIGSWWSPQLNGSGRGPWPWQQWPTNPPPRTPPWQAQSSQLCRQAVLSRQSSNCRRRSALSSKWQQAMALKPTMSALLLPLQWRQQPWRVCYAGPRLSMLQQWRWQRGEWTKRRASPA